VGPSGLRNPDPASRLGERPPDVREAVGSIPRSGQEKVARKVLDAHPAEDSGYAGVREQLAKLT
jgi:hypothetical protein